MFGIRSPILPKNCKPEDTQRTVPAGTEKPGSHKSEPSVRRSIGEWETGKLETQNPSASPNKGGMVNPLTLKPQAPRRISEAEGGSPKSTRSKISDRVAEAKACVVKAKTNLSKSGNLKREIKDEVTAAIDRLFQLVKESDLAKGKTNQTVREPLEVNKITNENEISQKIAEHSKLLKENNEKIEKLTIIIRDHKEMQGKMTYASAVATKRPYLQTALHSVIVTAENETETGEEVLNKIRTAVNAKEEDITVEKVRKTKDRKVIIGCKTIEDRQKIKDKICKSGQNLKVEEIQNKNPLVILRNVLKYNSDEEVQNALRTQNKDLFKDIENDKIEIVYKKRARNPLVNHVVLRVSPKMWQRMVGVGSVHIDLQRVFVADQSPLVQCSLCLGYGHGRRFCKDTLEKCCHCGGPHMKTNCPVWLADETPTCCNCLHAKLNDTAHNAFSQECTVRRRWEALARAKIAYDC